MSFVVSQEARQHLFTNGVFLVTDVTHEGLGLLASWIVQNRPKKKKFTIAINSSGGLPSAVIQFASFLNTVDPEVRLKGVAFGECGSAALALLLLCHERIAVESCGFFIHHVHATITLDSHNSSRRYLREEFADARNIEREIVRLQCKRSGLSETKWMALADRGERVKGRAIFPKEALQLGLIQEIVEHFTIF